MANISVSDLVIEFPVMTRGMGKVRTTDGLLGDKRIIRLKSGKINFRALNGVSFDLEAGDRLGLIGSNGSGKSTLLLALAGIYEPNSGQIETEGRVEALFNPRLGFKQEATGRRNIFLRGLIRGWSKEKIEAATDEIIAFSELGHFIDMPLHTYSQGMAARLGFATSTAFAPDILLMDEWIGAGDSSFQAKAAERMKSFIDKTGIVVIASHNNNLLRKLCNKAIRLETGQIADYGQIGEVIKGMSTPERKSNSS